MDWINYKNYSHYNQLEQLYKVGLQDYQKFVNTDIKYFSEDITKSYSHIPWPENVDWHMQPLIRGGQVLETYKPYWGHTISFAKNIPGLISLNVNFVDAHSIVPDHKDDMPMLLEVDEWRKKLGYITVIGIDVPGETIEESGFHVNHNKKHLKNGDIITIDGSNVHGSWNNTDKRRVTFYVSINKDYYVNV
jgi:hypothetical protein